MSHRVRQYQVNEDDDYHGGCSDEENCQQVKLADDQFSGLIGNIASGLMKEGGLNIGRGGGGGGQSGNLGGFLGDLAGQFLKGGGGGGKSGGGKKGGLDVGGLIGGILGGGGKKGSGRKHFDPNIKTDMGDIMGGGGGGGGGDYSYNEGGGGGYSSGGDGQNKPDIGNIIGGLIQGGSGKGGIGSLIGGLMGGKGGGGNIPKENLNGGLIDTVSQLIGYGAHRFLGVDPATGHIIGAIAGNIIFNLGGKDNVLGNIGKIVLDNIITGKYKRKVDPWIPPEPSGLVPKPPPPPMPGQYQEFERLRRECLERKVLFEDDIFPAEDSSLFYSQRPSKRIEWLRPGEICQDPQLFVEGHSRFDVVQGELGDCWLLAAMANLTLRDELFYRVVPPDQSFTENYAGIFHFQIWHYGKWVDVVIDDRLPTHGGKLLYLHSPSNNEYWSALLEKAYAKLHGSYEALKGGTTSEALEDFTGGLTEFIDLKAAPSNLLQLLFTTFELGSLMGCSIEVTTQNGKVPLLRIRNPWGNEHEWNGAWSDNSREWSMISEQEKRALGLKFAHDGEFWITFDDFIRNFEKLEICNLGPEVAAEIEQMTGVRIGKTAWQAASHEGEWITNKTAGGCRNFIRTFANNPQYRISLTDADPNDADDLCTCVMSVLQMYRRESKASGVDMLPIGFAIYKVDDHGAGSRLDAQFFSQHKSTARSPVFINLREVCGRFRLPPGNYVMVPSTFEPNNEGNFMVRIFTNGLQNGWPPNMTAGFLVYTCNWKLHELVAQMAIVDLKAIGVMPSDLNFKFYSRQSCDDESAMNTSLDLYKNYHVNVFFGPECFAAISITALLAANLDLPTFGYLSVSSQLENKRKYKTLVRTANSMSYMSQAIREVLLYFKWRRIVVIRVPGSTCDVLTDAFPTTFSDTNVNVVSTLMVNYNDTNSMQSTLDQLKLEAR
uniref:Calpain catalytic domain-containing protein n=1 Tax=Romanomermis culicivorax TaxID=13658 RepID=A0A915HUQ0_ROMCU